MVRETRITKWENFKHFLFLTLSLSNVLWSCEYNLKWSLCLLISLGDGMEMENQLQEKPAEVLSLTAGAATASLQQFDSNTHEMGAEKDRENTTTPCDSTTLSCTSAGEWKAGGQRGAAGRALTRLTSCRQLRTSSRLWSCSRGKFPFSTLFKQMCYAMIFFFVVLWWYLHVNYRVPI